MLLDTRQYNRDLTDLYYNSMSGVVGPHSGWKRNADNHPFPLAASVQAIKDDEARSLMGGRQENWLYSQMKNASTRGAQWKVLGQQIVCTCSNRSEMCILHMT